MRDRAKLIGLVASLVVLVTSVVPGEVVINEIHYNPVRKTEPAKFVELYNTGTNTVDLAHWRFTSGIEYTFPPGTQLEPDHYLVVAQNPDFLRQKYGVNSLGPFGGNLSGKSDQLVLCNALGELVDEVTYQLGFPWPTVGDVPECSIELINPTLDNNLGGSWRSWTAAAVVTNIVIVHQATTNFIPLLAEDQPWNYEQSGQDIGSDWMNPGFDDGPWPIGKALLYVENATLPWTKNTLLRFTSPIQMAFHFRARFNGPADPAGLAGLQFTALIDDGAVFYLNGKEVYRLRMSSGLIDYSTPASSNVGNATVPDLFTVSASDLVPGDNILAVEVHQANQNSSDIVFGLKLEAFTAIVTNTVTNIVVTTNAVVHGPTPGRRNANYAENAPPHLRQVNHQPQQPMAGEPVKITAKISDPAGVAAVQLDYQVVDPGSYIELTDAAYQANWASMPMSDDGQNGDGVAGDHIYTVTLPGNLQVHRRLVRYRITATDTGGRAVRAPYPDDPQPNFAYFVYNGVPAWTGSARPGVASAVTYDTNVMRSLPTYHLLAKSNAVTQCMWTSYYTADTTYPWAGTLVYDGKVYDHIHYRARGGVWRYAMGKNMWKFDLNRGHDFEARDNFGQKYQTAWSKLNLGACIQQGDYNHRGEQGLFESVGFKLFNLVGVPASLTHFIQFRVIDDAQEASATSQFNGDFWGLYLAVEQDDGRFLNEHGMPDGNYYKMEGGTGELNNQGATGVSDKSDLNRFMSTYNSNPTESWWRTNLDLEQYYGYQTIIQGIHHYDIADGKNYFYYLNPQTGIWSVHPWDLDLTWADNMYRSGVSGGDEPFKSRVLSRAAFSLEFKNRVREIQDLLFNTDQAYQIIDEFAAMIHDPHNGPSFTDADRAMWDYNPIMNSSYVNPSKAGQGRFYQFPNEPGVSRDFNGAMQLMKNYVVYRSGLLNQWYGDANIPATPVISSMGPTNFPANQLNFTTTAFQGSGAFAAQKWRVAEVTPPGRPPFDLNVPRKYEITAAWESEELTNVSATITVPAQAVKTGHFYRVRVKMKDTSGRWSHWSAPVELLVGEPDNTAMLQQYLRVTELMFNPPAGIEYEYLELYNSSTNQTLDLSGVKFTQGLSFAFSQGTTLAPNQHVLVVRASSTNNFADFRAHYHLGPEVSLAGPYTGSLDNNGETITLKAAGSSAVLFSFAYNNGRGWPVSADGAGHSLVPLDSALDGQGQGSANYSGNWRASAVLGGSPGKADPTPAPGVVLNEIMANTEYSDSQNPGYDSNDWIELYNTTAGEIALTDFFLSDDPTHLKKWAIPASVIPPHSFLTFDEVTGFHHPLTNGFGLSHAGEQVLLSYLPGTQEDRIVDALSYKGQELGISLGRYPDGGVYWYATIPTRNTSNSVPIPHAVINEIMYHPPDFGGTNDNSLDEFIEILNPTSTAIRLADTNGCWRLDGSVQFLFPTNTMLAPGGYLVLVNFDPTDSALATAFMDTYHLGNHLVNLLGPYDGKLPNDTGRIALEKPQSSGALGELVSWVIIDEVIYADQAPWPTKADGERNSLQRLFALRSGLDPANWIAEAPTPAEAPVFDNDGDGMPNTWELQYGLNPNDPSDAGADTDGDEKSNLQEYKDGTNPLDPLSYLELPTIITQPQNQSVVAGGQVTFDVVAIGNPALSYQWFFNGSELSGQTNATLILPHIRLEQAGVYAVTVYNFGGQITSREAILTISPAIPPMLESVSKTANGNIQLLVTGCNTGDYVLEVSTNLLDWNVLSTNRTDLGAMTFFDENATNFASRFYRVKQAR